MPSFILMLSWLFSTRRSCTCLFTFNVLISLVPILEGKEMAKVCQKWSFQNLNYSTHLKFNIELGLLKILGKSKTNILPNVGWIVIKQGKNVKNHLEQIQVNLKMTNSRLGISSKDPFFQLYTCCFLVGLVVNYEFINLSSRSGLVWTVGIA